MSQFFVSALRAIVEMLGLCLLGQAALYVLAGRRRNENHIYRLLSLITRAPRKAIGRFLPASASSLSIGAATFVIVLFLWLGLAFVRKFL